jgi:UrcA family protein
MFKLTSTGVAVIGAVVAFASAAQAGEGVKVAYGDLDLARASGAVTFDQRTDKAAKAFCRAQPRVDSFIKRTSECVAAVKAGVVEQLPETQRLALIAGRNESAAPVLASR